MECVSCAQYVSEHQERCPQCGRRQPNRAQISGEKSVQVGGSSLSSLQRLRDDFMETGKTPPISEWDRAFALRSLRSLSPADAKTFNDLATRYGGCGEDIMAATVRLLLHAGIVWASIAHWSAPTRSNDLESLGAAVHVMGCGERWPLIEQTLSAPPVNRSSHKQNDDKAHPLRAFGAMNPRHEADTMQPQVLVLHKQVPVGHARPVQRALESQGDLQEALLDPARFSANDTVCPVYALMFSLHGIDRNASIGHLSDELWARGYGFGIDAVPWRIPRHVNLKLYRREPSGSRATLHKLDAPTVWQALACAVLWVIESER